MVTRNFVYSAGIGLALLAMPLFSFAQSGPCPSLYRALSFGSRGSDVTALQQFLISQNLLTSGNATAYFGRLTQSAVISFQRQNGLPAYGFVGSLTRAAIARQCANGVGTQQSFSASPTSGPAPLAVTFSANKLDAAIYTIDFGDGNSQQLIPTACEAAFCPPWAFAKAFHVYAQNGTYTAQLLTWSCPGGTGSCTGVQHPIGTVTITVSGSVPSGTVGSVFTPPPTTTLPQACPSGTSGSYPNCTPVPPPAPISTQPQVCPSGTTGVYPNCATSTPAAPPVTAADGCTPWPGSDGIGSAASLQDALYADTCVSVAAGTYTLDGQIIMPSGRTLKGAGTSNTVLKANPQTFRVTDAILTHVGWGPGQDTTGVHISGLTLDGSGIAASGIVADGMTIDTVVITKALCDAVSLNGPGIVLRNSTLDNSAQTSTIPGRGTFTCASVPGGVSLGAGIYGEGYAGNRKFAPDIENNIIKNSIGPGMDINNVDGGTFANNTVYGNSGWAAVSLFQSSGWTVSSNATVSQPADASTYPYSSYHPDCVGGPGGAKPSAILLCTDSYALPGSASAAPSTNNKIIGNHFSSAYGILLIGAGTAQNPSGSPYGNDIENNDVIGSSVYGCADGFQPSWSTASVPANVWKGNDCVGTPNTPPQYF